ncbi:MAG: helix-turn-helix domain-containing protein [Desulfovibrionaceae bacterium]|nr:helix-turn-helix domain-containing protein [Desulfovibrionaceae bacterium]
MSIDAMRWAWRLSLRPTWKFILLSLADRADERHMCWPSLRRLANDTGYDERTVTRALRQMCEAGIISRLDRPGKGYVYTLLGVSGREDSPPHACGGTGCTPRKSVPPASGAPPPPAFQVGHPPHFRPSLPYREPKEEPSRNPKEELHKPKKAFGEFGNVLLTDGEFAALEAAFGRERTREAVAFLDLHLGARKGPDPYKSHYLAMRKWVFQALDERRAKQGKAAGADFSPGPQTYAQARDAERRQRSLRLLQRMEAEHGELYAYQEPAGNVVRALAEEHSGRGNRSHVQRVEPDP